MKKQENIQVPKTISVLLDLEGTSDFIDDQKAKLFKKFISFFWKYHIKIFVKI